MGFPGGAVVKNPPANVGDTRDVDLIPGWGRSPGGGNGSPPQYPCLENPIDRGAWRATVHGAAKSRARLSTHSTQGGVPGAGATEVKSKRGSCPDSEKTQKKEFEKIIAENYLLTMQIYRFKK